MKTGCLLEKVILIKDNNMLNNTKIEECKCETGKGDFVEVVSTVNCSIHRGDVSINKNKEEVIVAHVQLDSLIS